MDLVAAGVLGLTALIQTGRLCRYLFVTFATLAAVLAVAVWRAGLVPEVSLTDDLRIKHRAELIFILSSAMIAAFTRSRMTAIAALGVVGIGVALVFIMFGAPEVAITQFLVEVLQVILVAVTMLKLPHLMRDTATGVRQRDLALALSIGALVTLVLLAVVPDHSTLCRRQRTLKVLLPYRGARGPLDLLVPFRDIAA